MKKLISLIVLVLSLSFNANCQDFKCADLKIGKTYTIYGFKSKNPFEKIPKAIVKITRIKHGYVEYCWYYEYNKKNTARFSRSCEEFIEQINNRPKK